MHVWSLLPAEERLMNGTRVLNGNKANGAEMHWGIPFGAVNMQPHPTKHVNVVQNFPRQRFNFRELFCFLTWTSSFLECFLIEVGTLGSYEEHSSQHTAVVNLAHSMSQLRARCNLGKRLFLGVIGSSCRRRLEIRPVDAVRTWFEGHLQKGTCKERSW